jgi:transcriptional regulator with XRE-family HTH domain
MDIGKNIRNLRKAYGETQYELGRAINVEDNTISMYESGRRQPDTQTVQAIAEHYGLPVDRLMFDDFSEMDFKITSLTWEKNVTSLEIIFPLICTDKAMEDIHFAKGYEATIEIWNRIKKPGSNVMRSSFENAMEEYGISCDSSGIIESAANMLWLLFVLYSILPDEHSQKIGEAILHGKSTKPDFVKKYLLKNANPISKTNEENKKSYANENHKNVMALIRILKESSTYAPLADYYMALQYVIGMVNGDYSDEMNRIIGMEMMTSFLELGNSYAFAFVKNSASI